MPDSGARTALLIKASLIGPAFLAVLATDWAAFRAWRERLARWKEQGRQPPIEYQRDNRLWTIRLVAFGIWLLATAGLLVYVFGFGGADGWIAGLGFALSLASVLVFGLLRAYTR